MKVFIISCLLAVALSSNVQATLYRAPSYPDISTTPRSYPSYSTVPSYPVYPSYPTAVPESTETSETYNVDEVPSSNSYGRQESSNGDSVSGSYYVGLPDDRPVYYKDNGDGLTADVKYDQPSNKGPQPAGYQKH